MSRRIYVASSWRNPIQPAVVATLRAAGHEVYDFRNPSVQGPPSAPDSGFGWHNIDRAWESWTPEQFRDSLDHPLAIAGFNADHAAMEWADTFVLVQSCGRSAHLELGWACGRGKLALVLLVPDQEPELMLKEVGPSENLCTSLDEVVERLDETEAPRHFHMSEYDHEDDDEGVALTLDWHEHDIVVQAAAQAGLSVDDYAKAVILDAAAKTVAEAEAVAAAVPVAPLAGDDPIAQCINARLANDVHDRPGSAPTASLYEIVDAVRAHKDGPSVDGKRTLRILPDPRLIAAVVACRDYDPSSEPDEAIIVLNDPRTGRRKALVCIDLGPTS